MSKPFAGDIIREGFGDCVDPAAAFVILRGSIEPENLHLPLGVGTSVADGTAARFAGGPCIPIEPLLPTGCSRGFKLFPAAISQEHETLSKFLTAVVEKIRPDHAKPPAGTDSIAGKSAGETAFRDSVRFIGRDIREPADTGVVGDPAASGKAKGERLFVRITGCSGNFLRGFRLIPF